MNKRGFAITGIMYISLLIFLMVVVGMLTVLGARKNLMDNYRKKILEEIETPAYANFYETNNLMAFYDSLINSKMIDNSEITDTTFYDVSENSNDGILTGFNFLGNDEWKTDALVFDSAAATVDSGLAGDLYTSFTIETYFKMNSVVATGADPTQSNSGVILGSYGVTNGFGISWITENSDDTKYKLVGGARDAGGTNYIIGPEIYDFTKKIHVALVYSDTLNELSFYIDGILVDVVESISLSLSSIGNIEANLQHVYDGNFEAAATKMDLYTIRIYDRALASHEISGNKAVDKFRVISGSAEIGSADVPGGPIASTWNYNYGGTGIDYFYSVTETNDGGFVAVGQSDSVDEDLTGLNIGSEDAIIVKFDSSGNIVWRDNFGGTNSDQFRAVSQTSDDGFIVAGLSMSTDGDLAGKNKGGMDGLVVKYDSSGTLEWNINFGGSGTDYLYSIEQTSDGGYIAGGASNSTADDLSGKNKGFIDAVIVKFNSSGAITWNYNYGGMDADYFREIKQTSDGGYIAVGNSNSTDGDLTGMNIGNDDAIIVKYDNSGTIEWKNSFGGTGDDYFQSVAQTSDGNYIVAGYSYSNDVNMNGKNNGSSDGIVARYNSSGGLSNSFNYGGTLTDVFYDVKMKSDDSYIVAGYAISTDFDLSGLNKGGSDAIVVKYTTSNALDWAENYGGSGADSFNVIIPVSSGGYVAIGNSSSNDLDIEGLGMGNRDAIIFYINGITEVVEDPPLWSCGDVFVDSRDDKHYNTVRIGSQCWFADNLAYTTSACLSAAWNTSSPFNACRLNGGTGWNQNEVLYQWEALMDGNDGLSGNPVQGLCPTGWHLPSHDDFTTLERAVCSSGTCAADFPFNTSTTGWRGTIEGQKIKTTKPGWNGTNVSGFTAKLPGYLGGDEALNNFDVLGYVWTSTPNGTGARFRGLYSENSAIFRDSTLRSGGYSGRCIYSE